MLYVNCNFQFAPIFSHSRITIVLSEELAGNSKEIKNQKQINTKCFLVTTGKCGPFETIGDHKFFTTEDLILVTKAHLAGSNLLHSYEDDP